MILADGRLCQGDSLAVWPTDHQLINHLVFSQAEVGRRRMLRGERVAGDDLTHIIAVAGV